MVCGLSMGGTLTLRLAELYPDAMAGIVLVNPSVADAPQGAKFLRPLAALVAAGLPGNHR